MVWVVGLCGLHGLAHTRVVHHSASHGLSHGLTHGRVTQVRKLNGLAHGLTHARVTQVKEINDLDTRLCPSPIWLTIKTVPHIAWTHANVARPCEPRQRVTRPGTQSCVSHGLPHDLAYSCVTSTTMDFTFRWLQNTQFSLHTWYGFDVEATKMFLKPKKTINCPIKLFKRTKMLILH